MNKKIPNIISNLSKSLCFISSVMLVLLMFLGAIDVIARYLFNQPIKGCLGINEILLVGLVFLAWPYTQADDGNVKVEIFYSKFRQKTKCIVGATRSVIALIVFSIMAWQSVGEALDAKESMEIIDVLYIPTYPIKLLVTIGVTVLCLQLALDTFNNLKALKENI